MSEEIEIQYKPRRPWLAALLSLVATGVGQLYNGQWKKGLLFFVAEIILAIIMYLFWADFASMLLTLSILLGFNIFVAGEAFVTARAQREYRLKPCNKVWLYVLFLSLNMVVGGVVKETINTNYFKTFKIPSGSMIPTLIQGDYFMAEMLDGESPLERGTIAVLRYPDDEERYYVKRIIGLPGETLEIIDRVVYIDGRPLEEPYARFIQNISQPVRDVFWPITLGQGEYIVVGDNRQASYDSRWIGPIKRERILGRAKYIYFPGNTGQEGWFDRIGNSLE